MYMRVLLFRRHVVLLLKVGYSHTWWQYKQPVIALAIQHSQATNLKNSSYKDSERKPKWGRKNSKNAIEFEFEDFNKRKTCGIGKVLIRCRKELRFTLSVIVQLFDALIADTYSHTNGNRILRIRAKALKLSHQDSRCCRINYVYVTRVLYHIDPTILISNNSK